MTTRSLKDILAFHGDYFARAVDCKRIMVILAGPSKAAYRKGFEEESRVNEEIWENVVHRGEAIRIEQAEAQLRNPGARLRSALAVPLLDLAEQPIGLLYAESQERFSAFNERHLAAARGRALLLSTELAESGYTGGSVDAMATVTISKEAFWLRMIQQGLQKEESQNLEAAEEQLRAALGLAKEWGADDARVIRTEKHLARVLVNLKKYDEATELVRECLIRFQQREVTLHPDLASLLVIRGAVMEASGDLQNAETLMIKALDIWEGLGAPDHHERAWALDVLGGLYYRKGDYLRAGVRAKDAADIAGRLWGEEDPRTQLYRAHLIQVRAGLELPGL